MRITCKCGGKRYAISAEGRQTGFTYYKCNTCHNVFKQSKRGRAVSKSSKSLLEILPVLSSEMKRIAAGIDAAVEVIKEETNKDVRIKVDKLEESNGN